MADEINQNIQKAGMVTGIKSALQLHISTFHLAWTWFPKKLNLRWDGYNHRRKVAEDKDKLQKMINKVVDLMIQDEAFVNKLVKY